MNLTVSKDPSVTEVDILLTGLGLAESPGWHDGRVWCSDWIAGEIIAVDQAGAHEVVAHVPSFPFCFDWLPDGRLRRAPDGHHTSRMSISSMTVRRRGERTKNESRRLP